MKLLDLLYNDHWIELLMRVPIPFILVFMIYNVLEIFEKCFDDKED